MKYLILLLIFFLILSLSLADTITIESESSFWWNDTVEVSGIALYENGSARKNERVEVYLKDEVCINTTDSEGFYYCVLKAPLEIGKYDLIVNITNSSGHSFINSTVIEVKITYGKSLPKVERSLIEVPIIIQEPSGRIKNTFLRIIVWS